MAKKSRKTAARYTELAKRGKKSQHKHQPGKMVSLPPPDSTISKPAPALSPQPDRAQVKSRPLSQPGTDYRYLSTELKRIGILAGAIVVILIVLAFILG